MSQPDNPQPTATVEYTLADMDELTAKADLAVKAGGLAVIPFVTDVLDRIQDAFNSQNATPTNNEESETARTRRRRTTKRSKTKKAETDG